MITIRPALRRDRDALVRLPALQRNFNAHEVATALEVIDASFAAGVADYRIHVAVEGGGRVPGFICYGPIPLTDNRYDLYWIAVDPARSRQGIGRLLVEAMEEELRASGPGIIYVDTSSTKGYEAARAFYRNQGYREACTLPDFYRPGDDKVIFCKEI